LVEKFKLNLIVGFMILLVTIFLIWTHRVWDWIGNLLLLAATVLIIWTLIVREKKPAKLLEFFIKSFIVSYAVTSIIWFANVTITSPLYYSHLNFELLMNTLIYNILPWALLPVAFAVIVYGIFRTKLRAREMFLSSWYVTVFIVFIIYGVWWALYVEPNLPEFYYSSIAGGIALALGLVLLSFIIAGILTIIYVVFKRQKIEPKIYQTF
jgi:hypothetical protein